MDNPLIKVVQLKRYHGRLYIVWNDPVLSFAHIFNTIFFKIHIDSLSFAIHQVIKSKIFQKHF